MSLEARIAEITRQGTRDEQVQELCALGARLLADKDEDGALACFDRAIRVSPESARVWVGRGSVLAKKGRTGEALGCIARALDHQPGLLSALVLKADLLLKSGARGEALECLDEAVRANEDDVFLRLGRGRLLEELERHAEAAGDYEAAIRFGGEDADGWHRVGTAKARARDEAGSKEALAKFLVLAGDDDPRREAVRAMLGQMTRYARKPSPAPAPAARAPKVTVTETTELRSTRRPSDTPRVAPEAKAATTKPDLRDVRALLAAGGREREALGELEPFVQAHPRDVDVWILRADVLRELGEHALAADSADEAMRIDRGHVGAIRARALCALAAGDRDRALDYAERAYALAPADPAVHLLRGECLVAVDRHLEAVYAYEKAVHYDRTDAATWLALGRTLRLLRRGKEAREALERAIALAPDRPAVAREARSLLERLAP